MSINQKCCCSCNLYRVPYYLWILLTHGSFADLCSKSFSSMMIHLLQVCLSKQDTGRAFEILVIKNNQATSSCSGGLVNCQYLTNTEVCVKSHWSLGCTERYLNDNFINALCDLNYKSSFRTTKLSINKKYCCSYILYRVPFYKWILQTHGLVQYPSTTNLDWLTCSITVV